MSLTDWSWDPALFYIVPAAALYALGSRQKAGRPNALQAAAFYAGLLSIVLAVDSPIDAYADELLWIHMLQHILLLTVAPPLILLGRPWPTMWRALPLGWRTTVAREVAQAPASAPLRALARPAGGVDPLQLHDHLLAHPGRIRLDGEQRRRARV